MPNSITQAEYHAKKVNDWLLALLRYAVTLHDADKFAVLLIAEEIDKLGSRTDAQRFNFFVEQVRTLQHHCGQAEPKKERRLTPSPKRIDDGRLGRAFAAAIEIADIIGSYRVLRKLGNAIVKIYGKVFVAESLAASAPDNGKMTLVVDLRADLVLGSLPAALIPHLYQRRSVRLEFLCSAPLHCRAKENSDGPAAFHPSHRSGHCSRTSPASLVNFLRTQIAVDVRTYRPEKYYMRGPGPKWREKNALGPVSTLRPEFSSRTTTKNVDAAVRLLRATTLG